MTPTLDALVRQLREAMAESARLDAERLALLDKSHDDATWDAAFAACVAADERVAKLCSPANITTLLDALTAAQTVADTYIRGARKLESRAEQAEAEAARLREQVQALTERAIVWPAVLRAAIADVWEARDEAAKMRRSWQQADGALDEAAKENDRHIQRIVELEQQVQALQGELAEARRDAENETAHREATHEEYVRACEERDAAQLQVLNAALSRPTEPQT